MLCHMSNVYRQLVEIWLLFDVEMYTHSVFIVSRRSRVDVSNENMHSAVLSFPIRCDLSNSKQVQLWHKRTLLF